MNNNRIRLTESQLRRIVKESVDSILKEGSKTKDPMAQWFNDFNKASKNRDTMLIKVVEILYLRKRKMMELTNHTIS